MSGPQFGIFETAILDHDKFLGLELSSVGLWFLTALQAKKMANGGHFSARFVAHGLRTKNPPSEDDIADLVDRGL